MLRCFLPLPLPHALVAARVGGAPRAAAAAAASCRFCSAVKPAVIRGSIFIKGGAIIYLRLVCLRFLVLRERHLRFLPVFSAFFNAAYDFSSSVGSLGRIAAATAARCACCAGVKLLKFIFRGAPFGATITGSGDSDAPVSPASR